MAESTDTSSDEDLARRAALGERASLEILLARHLDQIHAICRRILGHPEDALDATQEALIAITRGINRFDNRSRFTTWMYRVATNAALDEARRRRRRPLASEHLPELATVADTTDAVDARLDVDAALATLPADFRAAVALRDLAGLDYAEIATVLDIPIGTVRSRIAARPIGPRRPNREPRPPTHTPNPTSAMNTPNEPPDVPPERDAASVAPLAPLAPVDPLDERLSAALDGHPAEPDSGPLDARAVERGRDLAAARDLLTVRPAPLDDVTRRRLLRTALDASPTSSRSSGERVLRWVRVGGAAAAVLAVVALSGWGLASLNQSSSKKGSASLAAAGTTAPAGPVDLNEVSNADVLKRRVEAALGVRVAANGPTVTGAVPSPEKTAVSGSADRSVARCVATVRAPTGDTPELLGTATFHGAPALVVVAREQSRTLIFVVATADCRLLSFQFLKQ